MTTTIKHQHLGIDQRTKQIQKQIFRVIKKRVLLKKHDTFSIKNVYVFCSMDEKLTYQFEFLTEKYNYPSSFLQTDKHFKLWSSFATKKASTTINMTNYEIYFNVKVCDPIILNIRFIIPFLPP